MGKWRRETDGDTGSLSFSTERVGQKVVTVELLMESGTALVFINYCQTWRIFNIRWPEKIRNEELWERAGQEPAAKQILRRKMNVFISGLVNSA
nr:hypothetical protein BaRGS_022237 [Batillaria attramentaria]